MTIHKKGSARWSGGIKDGKGFVSTETSALSAQPYGFNARFENGAGTNPEELIAAAQSRAALAMVEASVAVLVLLRLR